MRGYIIVAVPSRVRSFSHTHFHWLSQGEWVAERTVGLWFCGLRDAMLWQPCFPRESAGVWSLSTPVHGGKDQLF